MKIALINTIKPEYGAGDGITEYTYQLYRQFSKSHDVDRIYSMKKMIRYNIRGLVYTNTLFKNKIRELAQKEYNIIHITNHEVGFAAKIIKKINPHAKVITTLHDLARIEEGIQRGVLQHFYNRIVKNSISSALRYSDFIIFNSSQTKNDVNRYFTFKIPYKVINMGVKGSILKTALHAKSEKRVTRFNVGFIGSFASHKNVIMLLKVARLVKNKKYGFLLYGGGIEYNNLIRFRKRYGLENVYFMGFASERRLAEIYDSFDAFVFPSIYEGVGLPILEAQARGIPVIIYKYGKIPKEIRKYCFEAEDEKRMVQILEKLEYNGYDERLKKKSMTYARSFTWEKTSRETLKVYKKVLGMVK